MASPRVAVLASGEGTTAEAVSRAWAKKANSPSIELIISNNPEAGILRRFPNVESVIINSKNTENEELAILSRLEAGNFDLIFLAGYMKMIGPKLVERFGWRSEYKSSYQAMMLNTHPGLLPDTVGLIGIHVQEHVLQNNLKAGHTLHVVSKNYDEGPTVTTHKVPIESGDTAESLFKRVKTSERKYLPGDIADFIKKRKGWIAQNG